MARHEQTLPIIIIKTLFVSVFTILSIIENLCVMYAIKKFKTLQTVPNYFIASLSLADFLYAVFGSTSIIATTVSKEWVLGGFYCNFIGVTNTLFLTASIATLCEPLHCSFKAFSCHYNLHTQKHNSYNSNYMVHIFTILCTTIIWME